VTKIAATAEDFFRAFSALTANQGWLDIDPNQDGQESQVPKMSAKDALVYLEDASLSSRLSLTDLVETKRGGRRKGAGVAYGVNCASLVCMMNIMAATELLQRDAGLRLCPACREIFIPKRSDQKFCSPNCQKAGPCMLGLSAKQCECDCGNFVPLERYNSGSLYLDDNHKARAKRKRRKDREERQESNASATRTRRRQHPPKG
jgi:hypothetical protein